MSGTVGFVGLGRMGLPMATNLARAGVRLVCHDTSPAAGVAAAGLAGAGGGGAAGGGGGPAGGPVACASRPKTAGGPPPSRGRGGAGGGPRPGLVTCDCSTVGPEVTTEIAAALAARGVTHMDTPMLGSEPQAVAGEIFFIVGGDRAKVDTVLPYLAHMGTRHVYVGPAGTGNRIKLIHNGLAAVTAVAVAEALAVCVASGVDRDTFYEVVRQGGGMAYGTYFERRAKRVLDGDFSPTFTLELMRKDAALALALAGAVKVPAPLLEETRRTYDEAVTRGWGREDFSAVTHVVEHRIGRALSAG